MAKDSCLECGKPFPPNKELASVPLARLVAFDPDANRVWRICEPCAHWNLLGPEAARAATPELLARSEAAVSAGDMGLGLVATESGSLLLFRVGAVASQDAVALKAAEIHAGRQLPRSRLFSTFNTSPPGTSAAAASAASIHISRSAPPICSRLRAIPTSSTALSATRNPAVSTSTTSHPAILSSAST